MAPKRLMIALCAATIALATGGCALLTKADLVAIRYFSPEQVKPHHGAASPSAPNGAVELRLGRVTSSAGLRERIAYRDADFELGYYDQWRWTERPDTYVRRELGRALFEQHGMHRVLDGIAPTLDVEVVAFDDLRLREPRAVRVQLKVILYEDQGVIYEETVTVERVVSVPKPKIEDVVAVMAEALAASAEQVTQKVEAMLLARRKEPVTRSIEER